MNRAKDWGTWVAWYSLYAGLVLLGIGAVLAGLQMRLDWNDAGIEWPQPERKKLCCCEKEDAGGKCNCVECGCHCKKEE